MQDKSLPFFHWEGDHTQQGSLLAGTGGHFGCWGLNSFCLHARQDPHILYYLSNLSFNFLISFSLLIFPPTVMSHKRTASADHKQNNQINFTLPKKDGLSFLGGLRSKNDFLSRSNVCINGNHVYMEQPEAKNEAKDSSASSSPSPQSSRKKHLFSSTENLAARSWKEIGEGGVVPSDKRSSESPGTDSLKSMSLPPNYSPTSSDIRESPTLSPGETGREAKETKKQEGKKSFLSLVTGKKDTARTSDGDSPPAIPKREKEVRPKEDRAWPVETPVKRAEKDPSAAVSGRTSLNPFEEAQATELKAGPDSKSEPTPLVTTARAPQTKAVKPR